MADELSADASTRARFVAREIVARFEREMGATIPASGMRLLIEAVGEACYMRGVTAGMEHAQKVFDDVMAKHARSKQ